MQIALTTKIWLKTGRIVGAIIFEEEMWSGKKEMLNDRDQWRHKPLVKSNLKKKKKSNSRTNSCNRRMVFQQIFGQTSRWHTEIVNTEQFSSFLLRDLSSLSKRNHMALPPHEPQR